MKVYYRLDHDDDGDRHGPLEITRVYSRDDVELPHWAQKCADHYHANGGWESSWPLEFTLFDDQDRVLGVFDVTREYVPEFYARSVLKEATR